METHIPHICKGLTSETRKRRHVKTPWRVWQISNPELLKKNILGFRKEKHSTHEILMLSYSCTCIAWRSFRLSGIRELALCVTVRKTYENVLRTVIYYYTLKRAETCTPIEYTYFSNAFFAILYISLALSFVYCRQNLSLQATETVRITVPKTVSNNSCRYGMY
jgi:hypothetical protein